MVASTVVTLQGLLQTRGKLEKEFFAGFQQQDSKFQNTALTHVDKQQQYQRVRTAFIQSLIDALRRRFPENEVTVLSALATVFDVERYPQNDLPEYGQADLAVLVRHYSNVINVERAKRDFPAFKVTMANYGVTSFDTACRCVIRQLFDQFPDFVELAKIALVIPVSSVCAERGFSLQNLIKTSARNRLSESRVNRLQMLRWHGKSLKEFNVDRAREHFSSDKNRRK